MCRINTEYEIITPNGIRKVDTDECVSLREAFSNNKNMFVIIYEKGWCLLQIFREQGRIISAFEPQKEYSLDSDGGRCVFPAHVSKDLIHEIEDFNFKYREEEREKERIRESW